MRCATLELRFGSYYKKLSEASKGTLEYQGGPMSEAEVAQFEKDPLKNTIILMRTWDEKVDRSSLYVALTCVAGQAKGLEGSRVGLLR